MIVEYRTPANELLREDVPADWIVHLSRRVKIDANNDGCWQWLGAMTGDYGQCRGLGNDKRYRVHRVYYAYFNGDIGMGDDVHHLCHNRLCVNPRHLITASRLDNLQESINRNHRPLFCCCRCGGGLIEKVGLFSWFTCLKCGHDQQEHDPGSIIECDSLPEKPDDEIPF